MTAKIYQFPRQAVLYPEAAFLGSLTALTALAVLMSCVAPWS
jgi:hypothetical protein